MSVNNFVCQLVISYVSDDLGFGLVLVGLNSQRPISVLHGVHPPCDRDIQSGCTPHPPYTHPHTHPHPPARRLPVRERPARYLTVTTDP